MRIDPPVDKDIRWVYEDARMLVVDKPADLPVHGSGSYRLNTLERLLRLYRPGNTIHLISRLDRETSGLVLVAKDPLYTEGSVSDWNVIAVVPVHPANAA